MNDAGAMWHFSGSFQGSSQPVIVNNFMETISFWFSENPVAGRREKTLSIGHRSLSIEH
jgi:hypothetical protein